MNTTVVLKWGGWCDITYFLKEAVWFRGISFHCVLSRLCISWNFNLCSHPTHYSKVNRKTNRLAIIDNHYVKSVRIWSYSDPYFSVRTEYGDTEYLSVFIANVRKYEPEWHQIRTLFMQWISSVNLYVSIY